MAAPAASRPNWRRVTRTSHIHFYNFIENTHRQTDTADAQAFQHFRYHAGGAEAALHLTGIGDARALERKDLLELYGVILYTQHFGNAQNLTGAVLQAGKLHHD